ncbi:hypothetical protein PGTUg99_024791 [Puccinia graminis f. sp. tritici]|uniref:Uncharacterized protein n=1 Tax=Puccinia graminis f. sp. tritici TaxID=56615 RepID=A0A5B0RAG4_PUCGR|nr:hypothetical protein PGTUg99_024791 [Puccinia graminis f. sp. tritici]
MVHFYRMVKDEHTKLKRNQTGFMNFNKFLLAYPVDSNLFPLLIGCTNQSLLTRYSALMGTWRKVKDKVNRSGSDGLFVALVECGMSDTMWNLLGDMHGNDAAAHAHGQVELEDPIESLLNDPGATPPASPENSASELPDDLLAKTESMNPPPNPSQSINPPSRRNRSNLPPLTAAEMALDSPSPPPAYESTPAQATRPTESTPAQATRPTPSRATGTVSVGAIPAATGSGVTPSTRRPPAKSGAPARRRGRYKEAPKKEDPTANGMLLLMHKLEEARLDERREAEARFNRKEEA